MTASSEERLLAAVYLRFGKPADYTDPTTGEVTPCTVQVYRSGNPQRQNPFEPIGFTGGHVSLAVSDIALVVRRSELARPEAGGEFQTYQDAARTSPGALYVIGGDALTYDAEGLEWRCPCSTDDSL